MHSIAPHLSRVERSVQIQKAHQIAAQHKKNHYADLAAAMAQNTAPEPHIVAHVGHQNDHGGKTAQAVKGRYVIGTSGRWFRHGLVGLSASGHSPASPPDKLTKKRNNY